MAVPLFSIVISLISFSTLMLFIGQQELRAASRKYSPEIPDVFLWRPHQA